VSAAGGSPRDITRFDRSAFSLPTGFRAGIIVSAPLIVGIVTGQKELLYSTLGALFLSNTEGPLTTSVPLRLLLVACFTEALAFGLGTLIGTTGLAAIPLMGLGVFVALMSAIRPKWAPVGTFTAIVLAVGVGLPGGSTSVVGVRLAFSLLGGLWGLAGIGLQRFIASRRRAPGRGAGAPSSGSPMGTSSGDIRPRQALVRSEAFRHAVIVGVTSSLGLAVGLALGLPRDFWIVVTIIFALRPSIGATWSFTTMMVAGTLVGAIIAASVTLEVTNDYLLCVFMLMFSIALYATRGMNLALTQAFLTPFIIILLNILYPGQWQLAETRILDVAIGGAIAVLSVYTLGIKRPPGKTPQNPSARTEPR
jgi:hypothetical protein